MGEGRVIVENEKGMDGIEMIWRLGSRTGQRKSRAGQG